MTVSERIFELIKERGYTQKEFSKKTGIAESTISDWKKKGTNPVSDKILMICEVLEVSPYFLLSGAENKGDRSRKNETLVVTKSSDPGELMACYEALDDAGKKEALEYIKRLAGEGTVKESAKAAVSVKKDKPKAATKPGVVSKPEEKTPDNEDKTKTLHLPDIRTIASEGSDHLIKASEEEDGNKKKKDKKDKKDKAGDKDRNKDKKKKDKSKDKGKDKKKKKKGYLLDR